MFLEYRDTLYMSQHLNSAFSDKLQSDDPQMQEDAFYLKVLSVLNVFYPANLMIIIILTG